MGCILEEIKPIYDLVLKNQLDTIKEIKEYVDNEDFEYNEKFIIKLCLSYTLQSLRNGEDLKRFQWVINDD